MPEKSKLYDRETAQRVLSKYPEFPEDDPQAHRFILQEVYNEILNGEHIDIWEIRNPSVIYSAAKHIHEVLQEKLEQPEQEESDLEREAKQERQPVKIRGLEQGQLSLFDGKPHTW